MPDVRRSSGRTNEERPLRHILELLQPYGSEVTLIGGWVPYLYQRYDDFPEWRTRIAGTAELDVLLPTTLVKKNRRPLAELLIIVYICDVLCGGERVTERVRIDILGLNEQKAELVRLRRTAAQRLSMIIERPTTLMDTAVQQRAEREAASEDAARSEMLGYLETLHSILKEPTR